MRRVLYIESGAPGVLAVNGQFCGPLDAQGQALPTGDDAEVYIQLFPFGRSAAPLTAALELRGGELIRLEPADGCYALLWPDGAIEVELRAQDAQETPPQAAEPEAANTLLRYLALRLAGDGQARTLLMNAQQREVDLDGYEAAVPLRFSPPGEGERFDERAGLVRRLAPNVARVDAALAVTSPAGRGHRLIERVEVRRG